MKKLLRRQIDPASERVGEDLRKELFPRFGVKWNAAENIVYYNHLTGVLLVRASQEDLEAILAAIETLGGAAADKAPRSDSASPSPARNPAGPSSTPPKQ